MNKPARITFKTEVLETYWVLKRAPDDVALCKAWEVRPAPNFPHSGLCEGQSRTPRELMKDLRKMGWTVSKLARRGEQFAKVDVTPRGFIVTFFATYAEALAEDRQRECMHVA